MLRRVRYIISATLILLGTISWCPAILSYYNLFVVLGDDNPARIYQLKVLPNGQIIDPNIEYTTEGMGFGTGSLVMTSDYRFLFASSDAIYRFQILPNGNLFSIGSTTPSSFITITPNNKLVIATNWLYTLTTSGDIVSPIAGPLIVNPKVDPSGHGILALTASQTFSAYTINYDTRTLNQTTSFQRSTPVYGFNYTSDGKLGFFYGDNGVTPSGGDLMAMKIDDSFNLNTTHIFDLPGLGIGDITVSNDNKFLWAPTSHYIRLYTIDTSGVLTDTGRNYYVLDSTIGTGARF
jgi:hypothetical protein